jgi:hypothetical protein
MRTLTIKHITTYRYRQPVAFGEHRMVLRPHGNHDRVSLLGARSPRIVSLRRDGRPERRH